MRILYIHSSFVPPPAPADEEIDRFYLLSSVMEGDVLQPVWFSTPAEVEAVYGAGSWPVYTRGRFRYHWFLAMDNGRFKPRGASFQFYLKTGLRLCRENKFDCMVVYSHMTTALMGVLLRLWTGIPLLPEIATSPDLVFLTDRPHPTLVDRLRRIHSDLLLHFSVLFSRRVHLLYPKQLAAYPLLRNTPSSVFHEFVPVRLIDSILASKTERPPADDYILLVGSPWYLKGTDLLVDAWRRLAPEYPGVRLKIVGHQADPEGLQAIVRDVPRVDLIKGIPNAEAITIISHAQVLILPSRCEGMGRVLIEAMAAGVPTIGTNVGGIPHMIRDGETGFVVPGGDSRALEARLRQLLADPALRHTMGEAGSIRAHRDLTESVYIREFAAMVNAAVRKSR